MLKWIFKFLMSLVPPRYADGTWTPVFSAGGGSSYPLSQSRCQWTRIGDRVFVDCDVVFGAVTTGTDPLQVTGLPYGKISSYYPIGECALSGVDLQTNTRDLSVVFDQNGESGTLNFIQSQDNGVLNLLTGDASIGSGDRIIFHINYITDDQF